MYHQCGPSLRSKYLRGGGAGREFGKVTTGETTLPSPRHRIILKNNTKALEAVQCCAIRFVYSEMFVPHVSLFFIMLMGARVFHAMCCPLFFFLTFFGAAEPLYSDTASGVAMHCYFISILPCCLVRHYRLW